MDDGELISSSGISCREVHRVHEENENGKSQTTSLQAARCLDWLIQPMG